VAGAVVAMLIGCASAQSSTGPTSATSTPPLASVADSQPTTSPAMVVSSEVSTSQQADATIVSLIPGATVAPPSNAEPLAGTPIRETPDIHAAGIRTDGTVLGQILMIDGCGSTVFTMAVDRLPEPLFNLPETACLATLAADDDYAVWEQESGNFDFTTPDWSIRSYSFRTGKISVLATWADYNQGPVPPQGGVVTPYLADGVVVWSASIDDSSEKNAVFMAPADASSEPEVLVENAVQARFAPPLVAYVDATDLQHMQLTVKNLTDGTTKVVRPVEPPGNIALTGNSILLTSPKGAELISIDDGTSKILSRDPTSQWPEGQNNIFVWYDESHSYAYSVAADKLWTLGSRRSANDVRIGGNTIYWTIDGTVPDSRGVAYTALTAIIPIK
jgi:hypothetical protein